MTPRDFLGNFFTLDPRKVDLKRTVILVLLVLLVASVLWHRLMPQVREISTTEFKRVPELKVVQDVQRIYVPCPEKGIKVLAPAQVAEALGPAWQPPAIGPMGPVSPIGPTVSTAEQVTATAEIPETGNGAQAVSVIDVHTGESVILVKESPPPWFQFRNDGALGVRYGIDQRLQPIGSVYGKWDFLRVRDLYFSANGSIETDGDAALQLGAEYRW